MFIARPDVRKSLMRFRSRAFYKHFTSNEVKPELRSSEFNTGRFRNPLVSEGGKRSIAVNVRDRLHHVGDLRQDGVLELRRVSHEGVERAHPADRRIQMREEFT